VQNLITILLFPFVTIYMIIPYLFTRFFGFGVFKKGRKVKQISFTFDDGPDPRYTPQLLDMLKEFDVKATFFVLGSKAEKYPDLIRRIYEEGHQIGIHNYTHTPNWIMTPWKVKRYQVDKTAEIVQNIIGERPTYYRPPWGILNLGDVFVLRKAYQIVMWSVMGWDWNRKVGADKLKRILLRNIKPGSVILLHDSGDTPGADLDAPKYMLQGLREVIKDVQSREFSCVRIDQLQSSGAKGDKLRPVRWRKRLLVRLWLAWDWLFCKVFAVRTIDPNNPFFKLRARKYQGSDPLYLDTGETIVKGDYVAELHFDNNMLYQFSLESKSSLQLAAKIVRNTQRSMPHIIHLFQTDPKYRNVKGIYGVTLIHRGAKQLGFTVSELPQGTFASASKVYLRMLLYALHPDGTKRNKTREELLVPKRVAMSRQQLMDRYTPSM